MRSFKTRSLKWVTLVMALALILGSTFGSAYALYTTPLFAELPAYVGEGGEPGGTEQDRSNINAESLTDADDESVSFLVLGVDESESLTDVMMLINLDMKAGKINVLQIPRDTYVDEDADQTGKLNSVYGHPTRGKTRIETLISMVNKYLKVSVDYYVTITLEGFRDMVDIIGGIEMDVPVDIIYNGRVDIKKGYHVLTGWQAEQYVRYRAGYSEGDVGRQKAQVLFLKALLNKMFSVSVKTAASVASQSLSKITTNLTAADMMRYYEDVKKIGKDKIEFHRVPGEGIMYGGYSIFGVDNEGLAELLNTYFRPNSPPVPAEDIPFIDLKTLQESEYYKPYGSAESSDSSSEDSSGEDESETEGESSEDSVYIPKDNSKFDYLNEGNESSSRSGIQK